MRTSDSLFEVKSQPTAIDTDFRFGLAVLMASGMAALGHEVLWTRRMIDLLGASTETSARVFECFFFGLCSGAAIVSLKLARIRRHWRFLGWVELGVAIFSVSALLLPMWTGLMWSTLGPDRLMSWQGWSIKTIFLILVIVPPTFLMGMTLPVLVSKVAATRSDSSKREILLYAANTFGGVFGLGVVVLLSLQLFGAAGSMLLMICINVAIAVVCFYRDRKDQGHKETGLQLSNRPQMIVKSDRIEVLPLALAFCSGAGVMALEVLGLALTNLSAPLSIYPQASILVCVILLLSIAAWMVARIDVRLRIPVRMLSVTMGATCLGVALIPVIFMHLPGVQLGMFGYGNSFGHFLITLAISTFASFGPAMLFAGMVFPLVVLWAKREDSLPGRKIGLLLAASGIGGIAGTETVYRLLLPNFGVHVSIGVIGVCYGVASLGLMVYLKERNFRRYLWPLAAFFTACYIVNAVLVNLPIFFLADLYKVVSLRTGREGSLAVVEDGRSRVMIFDNQYTLGGTSVTPGHRRLAHLPLMLHTAPAKVGFIGLGTGITASGALEHKAVESITAVELSTIVAEAAAREFAEYNHDVCRNPKVKIHVEDARIFFGSCQDSFDVIIGDLFTPWRPGEASLSSLEGFRAAHKALRSGGVFCQWIELTQWTPEQFQIAAATFRKVFNHLFLFRNKFETGSTPIALVGFKDGLLDWSKVSQRCRFEADNGYLADPLCLHPEGVAMLYLGEFVPSTKVETQVNTLNNLLIELSASREVVLMDSVSYYSSDGQLLLGFLDRQIESLANNQDFPKELRPYPKLGILATRFEIALVGNDLNKANAIAQTLVDQVHPNVRTDVGANWKLWAGSITPWAFLQQPKSSATVSPSNNQQ